MLVKIDDNELRAIINYQLVSAQNVDDDKYKEAKKHLDRANYLKKLLEK